MHQPIIIGVGVFLLLSSLSLRAAESVFVYYPTEVKAQAIQKSLVSVCPSLDFTVFGRSKDFRKGLETSPPQGVVTMAPIVDALDTYSTIAKGLKEGRTEDDYLLVSMNEALPIENLANVKIGVIDILGRKPMSEYVQGLLGQKVKLKRVTKVEDLLPLLSFGSVQGVLVSRTTFELINAKTNLQLVSLSVNAKLGLAQAATSTSNSGDNIAKCVAGLSQELNTILGVEQWKVL